MTPLDLASTYLRLRGDSTIEALPVDETFWPRIERGDLGTFHDEYLVSCFDFSVDWPTWEMHPAGDEIVCLLNGSATFVLDRGGVHDSIELTESGSFVIVPKGTWHTARIAEPCRLLFITLGEGTQIRKA